MEDATDLVLNIKSLVVKNHGDGVKTLRIDRHERGVVTAADVIGDDQIEILNPDHIIATLTDDVPFVLEMTLENGRGYQGAEVIRENEQEVGVIPVDALFSRPLRYAQLLLGSVRRMDPWRKWKTRHLWIPS